MRPAAVDCWLNVPVGFADYRPEFLVRVARDYFKREQRDLRPGAAPRAAAADGRGRRRAGRSSPSTRHRPEPFDEIVQAFPGKFLPSAVVDPTAGDGDAAADRAARDQARPRPGADRAVHGEPAAQRQGVLPGLRQVHRAGPAGLGQHRHSRTADAGRAAAPALPGRGVPLLPRARADHGARRRSVVGRGDPAAAQVPEPLHDDVGLRAEVSAGRAHPLHEYARHGEGPVRLGSPRACRSNAASREAEALPLREGVLAQYLRENALRVFRWPDRAG